MAAEQEEPVKQSLVAYARTWGESSLPPTGLATLIAAQALRPPQYLALTFPPILLFSSYLNVNGFEKDAAGITAAWSGLYMLLALRRKQPFMKKWGTRGIVRGATLGLCGANLAACGLVYGIGKREQDEDDESN